MNNIIDEREKLNVCLLNDSFPPVIDGVANTVYNYADIMTKEDLWNLFKQTGNITYYLKYKEAIKKGK